MNQLALARRYRPRTLHTVVGQEIILRALSNALDQKRLHHAYLFSGMQGVGKTTIARIFAKCLNCEQGIASTPCETCFACQAINAGHFVDLIEVDAASRTKVEDTRELLDNVQYLPTKGRFKIYLIDEVHMLSGHSFNALLKTLEEPPQHVKFLLATTDPQKLPLTVLSRCLQFHLSRLPIDKIIEHLEDILQQEQITAEKEALQVLSQAANGSVRDALSLLDQAVSVCGNHIHADAVRTMLGLTKKERLLAILQAIMKGEARSVLSEISALEETISDFTSVLTEFLTLLHQVIIAQAVPEALDDDIREKETILKVASVISSEEIQLYYQIGLQGQRDLPFAPTPRMGFEIILLRMMAFQPVRVSNFTPPIPEISQELEITKTKKTKIEKKEVVTDEDWYAIVNKLHLSGLAKVLAENCIVKERTPDFIHLVLDSTQTALMKLNKRYQDRLCQALCQYWNIKSLQLKITVDAIVSETPTAQQKRLSEETQASLQKKVHDDAAIQTMVQAFDATIEHITTAEE